MNRHSENGEGMEPSKSGNEDVPASGRDGEATNDGFAIVDSEAGQPSEPTKPTFPTPRQDSADEPADSANGSGEPDRSARPEESGAAGADPMDGSEEDPLSVDQWLAELETEPSTPVGASIAASGTARIATDDGSAAAATDTENMTDIMAEPLAAAEQYLDEEAPALDRVESTDGADGTAADDTTADDTADDTIATAAVEIGAPTAATAATDLSHSDGGSPGPHDLGDGGTEPPEPVGTDADQTGHDATGPNTTGELPTTDAVPASPDPFAATPLGTAAPAAGSVTPSGRKRGLPVLALVLASVVGIYLLVTVAWAVDVAAHQDEAMRGVYVAGVDVGGSDSDQLNATVVGLTDQLAARPIEVAIGETSVASDPVSLGAQLDAERMVDEALQARRDGFILVRPVAWVGNLFSDYNIEASYSVDEDVASEATTSLIAPALEQPVEPTLELQGETMTVSPGSPGEAVDSRDIVAKLPAVIDAGEPYRLELAAQVTQPLLETSAVTELADEINRQTEQPIAVQVLDDEADVPAAVQKSWIDLVVEAGEARWVVVEERALQDLKPLFPSLGSEDQQARFSIVDGEPIIIPASESVVCCAAGSGELLQAAIESDLPAAAGEDASSDEDGEALALRSATLEPIVTDRDEGVAELESLGIIEEVSSFTTEHACCQNRVTNIQRFADLTQGAIIRPGEEFSLNGFVGQRTREKGFVADGAISRGNFEQQVGGGISQYATTFFNASFFAGVEFLEYQSHSIYISRYPRGREATISWTKPDLKIRNNTDYGILVWNNYTPTSITVSFYSTEHLDVEALPLKRSSNRQCRIDITPRRITGPDGSVTEDQVFATYRPGEGLDCNGDSTDPEEEDEPAPPAEETPPTTQAPPPPEPEPEPDPQPEPEPEPEPDPGDDPEVLPPPG